MTHSSHQAQPQQFSGKIFLVGFMGSGKTYWGKKWARQCKLDFYDLDEVIEKQQKKAVAALFEHDGEEYFREIETAALKMFSFKENFILACGGGTACFNNNMQWMNEQGMTVYLLAEPQYILYRIKEEKDKRPLLKKLNEAALVNFVEQKLKARELFYNQAKLILPVKTLNEYSLTTLITKS